MPSGQVFMMRCNNQNVYIYTVRLPWTWNNSCHTKAKELSLLDYLLIVRQRIGWFIHFLRALAQNQKQITWSWIWTHVTNFISNNISIKPSALHEYMCYNKLISEEVNNGCIILRSLRFEVVQRCGKIMLHLCIIHWSWIDRCSQTGW